MILPISEHYLDYAKLVERAFRYAKVMVHLDDSDNRLAKKMKNAEEQGWCYILTVGKDEEALGMADARLRGGKQLGKMRVDELIKLINDEQPPIA